MDFNFSVVGNDATITWAFESLVGNNIVPCDLSDADNMVVKLGYNAKPDVEIEPQFISILPTDHSVLKLRIPGNHSSFQKRGWLNAEISFTKTGEDGNVQYFKANRSKCMQYFDTTEEVEALVAKGAEFNGELVKFKNSITLGNYEITANTLMITIEEGSSVLNMSTDEALVDSDAKVPTSRRMKLELASLKQEMDGATFTSAVWESKTPAQKAALLETNDVVYIVEEE